MTTRLACARIFTLLVCCAGFLGCDKPTQTKSTPADAAPAAPAAEVPKKAEEPAQEGANVPLAEAKAIMAQRCTLCHGLEGRGNGPAAANLHPQPANYTDPKWQTSVDDETLRKAIIGGGPAVGKSMMMPANPDLKDKPQVVDELVKLIRGFKK